MKLPCVSVIKRLLLYLSLFYKNHQQNPSKKKPIPDFQSFFRPLLEFAADGKEYSMKQARASLAQKFKLTEEELKERLPSGTQKSLIIEWHGQKATYLKRNSNNMSERKRMKYIYLKPGERIRRLIEEFVEPEMAKLGFKLLKSKLIFKRKKGGFTQEIYFAKNQRNFGNVVVSFWAILSITSNFYVKWHEKTYGFKPLNNYVESWYDSHIKDWESAYRNVTQYDLTKYDNVELMEDLTKNLLNIGVPLLNEVSDWEGAANYLMSKERYGFIAKIFDFYLLADKKDKGIEALQIAENYFKSVDIDDVPQERFEEIKIRREHLHLSVK